MRLYSVVVNLWFMPFVNDVEIIVCYVSTERESAVIPRGINQHMSITTQVRLHLGVQRPLGTLTEPVWLAIISSKLPCQVSFRVSWCSVQRICLDLHTVVRCQEASKNRGSNAHSRRMHK